MGKLMGLFGFIFGRSYASKILLEKNKMKRGVDKASLPVLSAEDFNYRPVGKEKLVAIHERVLDFDRANKYRPSADGPFSSLLGALTRKHRVPISISKLPREFRERFLGRLLLTDKAVIFESLEHNERITINQIAGVRFHIDGFTISKRNGSPRIFQIASPDPKFAAVLDLLLSRVE